MSGQRGPRDLERLLNFGMPSAGRSVTHMRIQTARGMVERLRSVTDEEVMLDIVSPMTPKGRRTPIGSNRCRDLKAAWRAGTLDEFLTTLDKEAS
jgi:hypothetical protein